ncbi:MAG: UDP-N-acetylglucosamine 2-epimerase (hydrolyzing) [Lachnospiraceae bacterium]|nr:UDP-N-acetylglucosamine 2-epimerase (hydrolyzing) [Lachnospiraceae bacterium]
MSYKICIVSGSRAEYDLLKPLVIKLGRDADIDLSFVLTGSHLSSLFGDTQSDAERDGIKVDKKIELPIKGDDKHSMAESVAAAVKSFSDYFNLYPPDIVILLGDRFEIFGTATAAAIMGIPIAHLYGGDTTEGAVDEFMRHSITKMSFLHFTSSEVYRKRVIQLGESPDRVFNVGSLGVENALNLPLMSVDALERDLGFKLKEEKYAVVTYHPVTHEGHTVKAQMDALISAMDAFPGYRFIITKSNADAGGREINKMWEEGAKKRANWYYTSSLGAVRYLSALKYSVCMLGNSSSGISEAPSLRVPTVNIGDRQKGRVMADSVICCAPVKEEIIRAIKTTGSAEFRESIRNMKSPFGDGNTSDEIIHVIKSTLVSGRIDLKKKFYDLEAVNWEI